MKFSRNCTIIYIRIIYIPICNAVTSFSKDVSQFYKAIGYFKGGIDFQGGLKKNSKSLATLFLDISKNMFLSSGSDQQRTEGKFESTCCCINHGKFSNGVEHSISRKTSSVAHRLCKIRAKKILLSCW